MPCLSGSFDPGDGIYHTVVVFPVPVHAQGGVISNQNLRNCKALFDTGAQVSCVSQRIAQSVGLTPRGRGSLVSASEIKETNVYLFTIGFVMGGTLNTQGAFSGHLAVFGPLQGLEIFAEESDDVDVLIGMDVLGRGALHVGFDGRFMFSW